LAPHPEPAGPWAMQQRWHDLLFAHWPVSVDAVRPLVPAPLAIDTHGGTAWIGVIPFHMTDVRVRVAPPVPTANAFAELNVRTYVTHGGRRGVWFFSLDAASTLAVIGARVGARLPYYRATIDCSRDDRGISFRSERWNADPPAVFEARYRPEDGETIPDPNSLSYFLTERYCLFSGDADELWRVDIHHPRWRLHAAQADILCNTMIEAAGLDTPDIGPKLHYSAFQDVRFWLPTKLD
jgi:uncharacterized protein YqjF (DUF2071 family)